jgi:hypothetical protein
MDFIYKFGLNKFNFCKDNHFLNTEIDEGIQQLIDKINEYLNKDLLEFGLNNKLAKNSFEVLKPI